MPHWRFQLAALAGDVVHLKVDAVLSSQAFTHSARVEAVAAVCRYGASMPGTRDMPPGVLAIRENAIDALQY